MTATPHRALLAALAATALAATLTACTTDNGEPPPTASPTVVRATTPAPTATLSEQDQNIADAKNTYLAFVVAYDAAARLGFVDDDTTTAVLNLTSGAAREALVSSQQTFAENGLHQEGETVVKALEAVGYQEDTTGAGMHGVELRACLDISASDTVYADGTSTTPTDQPQYRGPRHVYVQMLRQPGGWAVHALDPRPEERC